MSSIRDTTTVTVVTGPIDGRKRRHEPHRGPLRVSRVETYRIHTDVLEAALEAADGDPRRLDWSRAPVRDGVITMIRVLNQRA